MPLDTFQHAKASHSHSPCVLGSRSRLGPCLRKRFSRASCTLLLPHFPSLLVHHAASFFTCDCSPVPFGITVNSSCAETRAQPVTYVFAPRHHPPVSCAVNGHVPPARTYSEVGPDRRAGKYCIGPGSAIQTVIGSHLVNDWHSWNARLGLFVPTHTGFSSLIFSRFYTPNKCNGRQFAQPVPFCRA